MQLITQIVQILSNIVLAYFEALQNNLVTQIVTAIWLITGGTWREKRNELQQNVGELITHPINYDPKAHEVNKEQSLTWYPFDLFQYLREGFAWLADRLASLSKPVWQGLENGIVTEGVPEKILLGATLLGFFYADIIIGFTIAYEQDLIVVVPQPFQYYGIPIAFSTIGSAFAAGLLGFQILRESSSIWKNNKIKRAGLFFVTILFLLSVITAIGINLEFVISTLDLDQTLVNYIKLTARFSLQVLTRVTALLATLLIPFGAAFEGLLFVIASLLSIISVLIRTAGTIFSASVDLLFRIAISAWNTIIFLVVSPPERIISMFENRKKKDK